MSPTETLKHEHQIILLVLKGAEAEADRIGRTGEVDGNKVGKLVEFLRSFVDRCHHTKEESHLFARMHDHGMAWDDGPLMVMWAEHDRGRHLIAAMSDALSGAASGERAAVVQIKDSLLALVELYRQHIGKEDNVLFPLADWFLTPEDQQSLIEGFERVEEEMGEGMHEKYHQLAHELSEHS